MKTTFYPLMTVITVSLFLFSCVNDEEKKAIKSAETNVDTTSVVTKEQKNLTKSEAEAMVKTYVKENKKKYSSLGKAVEFATVGGDYDGDKFTDYLITVSFHNGESEFYDPVYFYFNSVSEELSELKLSRSKGYINWITFKSITKGSISTEASVWHDFVGERAFKCTATIEGNQLVIPKSAMVKAEKLYDDLQLEHELSLMDPAGDPENAE